MTNSEKFFQPLSPPPAIRLSRVNLSYESSVLFHDLDLELPAGRVSVLLGPSGVGKSSLLRLILFIILLPPPQEYCWRSLSKRAQPVAIELTPSFGPMSPVTTPGRWLNGGVSSRSGRAG